VEVQLHEFLTSPLHRNKWSVSRPGRYIPGDGEDKKCLSLTAIKLRPKVEKDTRLKLIRLKYDEMTITKIAK
jgi:hypothetical protein